MPVLLPFLLAAYAVPSYITALGPDGWVRFLSRRASEPSVSGRSLSLHSVDELQEARPGSPTGANYQLASSAALHCVREPILPLIVAVSQQQICTLFFCICNLIAQLELQVARIWLRAQ